MTLLRAMRDIANSRGHLCVMLPCWSCGLIYGVTGADLIDKVGKAEQADENEGMASYTGWDK